MRYPKIRELIEAVKALLKGPYTSNFPRKPLEPAGAAAKPGLKKLQVSTMMTVRELAERMEVKSPDVIKKLMALGVFATINQRLDKLSQTAPERWQAITRKFTALGTAQRHLQANLNPELTLDILGLRLQRRGQPHGSR